MADALVMFDRSGKILFANEKYRLLFPRTADVRVPGGNLRDILEVAIERGEQIVEAGRAKDWIDSVCASLQIEGERQFQLSRGNWVEARTRITAEGNSLIVFSDVTAAKLAEASLTQLNLQLDAKARTDWLTGLLNRRAFDAALEKEQGRAARNRVALSLLLMDVDHFKKFNDTYGHPAGDECLRAVSLCLQRCLQRPGDTAARYGGEEFAAILPETQSEGAWQVAEKLRLAVRDLNVVHAGSDKAIVTVSIGIATLQPNGSPVRNVDLVRRADEALYEAKGAGRDCSFIYGRQYTPHTFAI